MIKASIQRHPLQCIELAHVSAYWMACPPSAPIEPVLPLLVTVWADGDDAGGGAGRVCYHNHLFLLPAWRPGFQVVGPVL